MLTLEDIQQVAIYSERVKTRLFMIVIIAQNSLLVRYKPEL